MPNWCYNRLLITGPVDELKEFKFAVSKGSDSQKYAILQNLYPRPAEVEVSNDLWYEWSISNWGTKWPDCHTRLVDDDHESLTFAFDTAWSPCLPAIIKVSKMFPTLLFTNDFSEEGEGFAGTAVIMDGQVIGEAVATFGDSVWPNSPDGYDINSWESYQDNLTFLYETLHDKAVTAAEAVMNGKDN